MLKTTKVDDFSQIAQFTTPDGCGEFFIAIKTREGVPFPKALEELSLRYGAILEKYGLCDDTAAFSRIFLSDIVNQKPLLMLSPLHGRLVKGAFSAIEQKPINGGQVSLFSYHIIGNGAKIEKRLEGHSPDGWINSARVTGRHYSLLFTANFSSDPPNAPYAQTRSIFDSLASYLEAEKLNLSENLIRTWIFLRDVDCHYGDMVRARKEFFAAQGMTDTARFPASTGIQGGSYDPGRCISVDSLSMAGFRKEQIVRIEAPSHLSSTLAYGVTFERGLEVRFGDRSHLYISGTASINNRGEVLYIGDIESQTRRTIENIRALLATRNAGLKDLACIIAYARNFHDREIASAVLGEELGESVPFIFAEAPVCRPSWLVEVEGIAVIPGSADFPPFL